MPRCATLSDFGIFSGPTPTFSKNSLLTVINEQFVKGATPAGVPPLMLARSMHFSDDIHSNRRVA